MNNLITQLVNPQIVSTIRNFNSTEYLNRLIPMLIYIGLMLCAIAFILLFLIGGFQWITSGGNKQSLENARNKIINAITGLLVLLLLWLILQFANLIFGVNIGGLGIPRFGGVGGGSFPTQTPGGPTPTGGSTVLGSCNWVNNSCSCTCPSGYNVLYDCGATADYICPSDDCICTIPLTATPMPTATPTQTIGYYIITAVPVCSNGATPSIRTRFFYAIWPPVPLVWQYDSTSYVTGSHTVGINISSTQADDLYFGLENEDPVIIPPSGNNWLMPIGTPPSGMSFQTNWVPSTWNVHTSDTSPSAPGSYTINFDVPSQYCSVSTPTPTNAPVVITSHLIESGPIVNCWNYCQSIGSYCLGISTTPYGVGFMNGRYVTYESFGCTSYWANTGTLHGECDYYLGTNNSAAQLCSDPSHPQDGPHITEWTYCYCQS